MIVQCKKDGITCQEICKQNPSVKRKRKYEICCMIKNEKKMKNERNIL